MAAPHAEAAAPGQEKQAAGVPSEPAAGRQNQPQAWKAWLPLGIAVVVMPLLAYATTTFLLVPRMQKALQAPSVPSAPASKESHSEPASKAETAPAHAGQRHTAALNKLLVNVAGTMGSRYLLTSLTLVGGNPDFSDHVAQNEAQLRDMAGGVLRLKTIADLEKPGARNELRSELMAGFNSILGAAAVQEIYFTDFAIQ